MWGETLLFIFIVIILSFLCLQIFLLPHSGVKRGYMWIFITISTLLQFSILYFFIYLRIECGIGTGISIWSQMIPLLLFIICVLFLYQLRKTQFKSTFKHKIYATILVTLLLQSYLFYVYLYVELLCLPNAFGYPLIILTIIYFIIVPVTYIIRGGRKRNILAIFLSLLLMIIGVTIMSLLMNHL
ncbi:hypothetical protein LGQ02_01640 [Bacillus shivajii]|uniref:hypothetical protein n=1 Tax=Bacillus shivajii TaxID=1983719 RepID=UPI001CF99536|nr:hypothetical protein [Bacillus shivajii]UCZ53529.1 hypothetical protein LGQ02_01640 [Bacillus shivajii]